MDGIIDVSGLSPEEVAEQVSDSDLKNALDIIIANNQNDGYHGFNNVM